MEAILIFRGSRREHLGKDNILDGKINRNCPHQLRLNGEGYKTSIFIHSTLKPTNRVGSQTSKGCLLLDWRSMQRLEEALKPLETVFPFG